MNRRLWVACALVVSLVCLAGCGGKGVKTGTVYGKVTVDGQPLVEGTINFNALDGNTPTSGGKITNGSYSRAVPRGVQKVLISSPRVKSTRKAYDTPDSALINEYEETLLDEYTNPVQTPLSVDVNSGSVNKDFEVKKR